MILPLGERLFKIIGTQRIEQRLCRGSFLAFLNKKKIEIFPHPAYSPDLAPCDFWLFPQLKAVLRGQHFETTQKCITAA